MSPWRTSVPVFALACLAGCATWRPPTDSGDSELRARAVTRSALGVQVSASLLGQEESRRLLGTELERNGIQPVWLEIENGTPHELWLLKSGTGPDYFSPLEAAWSAHVPFGGGTNDRIDEHFSRVAFANPVPAHGTRSGLLFVAPHPRRTVLNVDLVGLGRLVPISLILVSPDVEPGAAERQLIEAASVPKPDYTELDSLRAALEQLPHCASTAGDAACSEPLNAVFIGTLEDIGAASSRRDFRLDVRGPDLDLRVFGRPPDVVSRKHGPGAPAIWNRAWLAPLTFQGTPVFVGQVARPVGGRFGAARAPELRMHGDIDEARDRLIQDAMYSGGLKAVGFLASTGAIPCAQPRPTGDGGSYCTDGHRVVLFFDTRPLTISDVQFLDWAPLLQQVAERARKGGGTDGVPRNP
jgi:hypothetical protein